MHLKQALVDPKILFQLNQHKIEIYTVEEIISDD